MRGSVRLGILPLFLAGMIAAAEHHGVVQFGGLPLPGATVTATRGSQKFMAVTGLDGAYEWRDLPDGVWNFEVAMQCFETARQQVAVAPEAPGAVWDLKLLPMDKIAGIAATAPHTATLAASTTVPAAPPATPPKRGKKKDAAAAEPANPAGGFQRASVNAAGEGAKSREGEATPQEMSGEASDGLLINGSINNGASSPFAQSAAFGNFRRAGRSLYNGNLGITFDNSALDARSYSITGQDTPKPAYNRFTGLFSFGGPLPFTGRMQNRPMFVVNYQWTRNRNASIADGLMPTAAQRAGEVAAHDPKTGEPFPNGIVPPSLISPQALGLLALYPMPNFSSPLYNYQVPLVALSHQDALQTRLNQTVGRMNQVNGSFAFQSIRGANPTILNFLDTSRQFGMRTNINWLHRFNQHAFLTLGAQYSRMTLRNTPYFAGRYNISGDFAHIQGNSQAPGDWGPPALTFAGGIQGLSDVNRSLTRNQSAGGSADLFWSRSPHNIHVGMDARRQQFNSLGQQDPRGAFAFTGAASGSDFADFLLGLPATVALAYGPDADRYFRSSMWDAYFTDDWRLSPGLTLDAGMRWEYGAPMTEIYGRLVNLDVTPGFGSVAPVVAQNATGPLTGARYPASLIAPDKRAFQPRIGIAWHPMLADSLVVRGAYGIYYDTSVYQSIAAQMGQQPPLSRNFSIPGDGLTMANAFLAPGGTGTFGIDPRFQPGYAQNWNVSLQRDLPGSLVMTASYLGTKGTHARQMFLPNTYPSGAPNPCPACPAGFTYEVSGGNSSRHAAELQVRRRLRAGLAANLAYTFSKAIDDAATGGRGEGGSVIAQNWLDLAAERGLSSTDQRHTVSLQAQYSTGQGLGGGALMGGWRGAVLKEWTFVINMNGASGTPLTPVYFAAVRGTGTTGSVRPDYTGAPLYAAPAGLALNPAAFMQPAPGQWGNAGRDIIAGPVWFSLNGSLGRTFQIGDRRSLDLRFDAKNVLNHVTFPSWNTTVNSSQFGLPDGANVMRSLQTTLRLRF